MSKYYLPLHHRDPGGELLYVEVDRDTHLLYKGRSVFRHYPNSQDRSKFYPAIQIGGKTIDLHRLVAKAGPRQIVDHRNRLRLDCRRRNLHIVSAGENSRNRGKGYIGVSRRKGGGSDMRYQHASVRYRVPCQDQRSAAFLYDWLVESLTGSRKHLNGVKSAPVKLSRITPELATALGMSADDAALARKIPAVGGGYLTPFLLQVAA